MKINLMHLFILLTAINMTGCHNRRVSEEASKNVIYVVTQQIKKVQLDQEIFASGNIEGNKTAKLGFMVAGKVNYIAIEEGEMVAAGQLLASLDPENYSIAKDMADVNLDQTQDEYNRLSVMYDRKSISESDYLKITNALKVAKAQQKLQSKNLSETKLYSPFAGVLLKKGTEVGEIIGTGLPLFVVSDIQTVKVNTSIPEAELHKVRIGSKASVYVSSIDSTFIGKVTEVGSVAEPTTRTFNVRIGLRNPKLLIRPGMTAEIKISAGNNVEVLAIPGESVLHDTDNSSYVFIVDNEKKQAFKRKVSLGQIIGDNVEITSGLIENEILVVGGQNKLTDGTSIEIK